MCIPKKSVTVQRYSSLLKVFLPFNEQRNVMRKQRNWERQLAAKKSKRKDEKQRRKLNREHESGKYQLIGIQR